MVHLAEEYEALLSPSVLILQTAAGNIAEVEGSRADFHQLKH